MNDFDKLAEFYCGNIEKNCEVYGDATAESFVTGCVIAINELASDTDLRNRLNALIKGYSLWKSRG
jgi:hypothetical protein